MKQPRPEGYASPEEGRRMLLSMCGGCVEVEEAADLMRQPPGEIVRLVEAAEIIAWPVDGKFLIPVWQFGSEGGLQPGLSTVLRRIRELLPDSGPVFAFAFFLQADPMCDGKSPLEVLKAGDVETVITALATHPAILPQ